MVLSSLNYKKAKLVWSVKSINSQRQETIHYCSKLKHKEKLFSFESPLGQKFSILYFQNIIWHQGKKRFPIRVDYLSQFIQLRVGVHSTETDF